MAHHASQAGSRERACTMSAPSPENTLRSFPTCDRLASRFACTGIRMCSDPPATSSGTSRPPDEITVDR